MMLGMRNSGRILTESMIHAEEGERMKLENVQIGVIGAGGNSNAHLRQLVQMKDECTVIGITDIVRANAEDKAQKYNIPIVFESAEELLRSDQVDAVVITVPNKFHAPLAVQALEAGKHVLLEKPMGINADDAKRIVDALQSRSQTMMIAHQLRWNWVPMQVKEQVERGELGNIYYAKTGIFRRKGIPGWGTWFTQKELSGGGPLIDIGVHMLDLTLHLMGDPKPISVYGSTYSELGPRKKGAANRRANWEGKFDVEDLAAALIKMEDGSTLNLEVSWAAHTDTDSNSFIHLMGTEGGAVIRGNYGKFLTEKFGELFETELKPPENDEGARARICRHFLSCIREGKQPLTSAATGLRNNVIIDAIYESSRTGKEVKLDWNKWDAVQPIGLPVQEKI